MMPATHFIDNERLENTLKSYHHNPLAVWLYKSQPIFFSIIRVLSVIFTQVLTTGSVIRILFVIIPWITTTSSVIWILFVIIPRISCLIRLSVKQIVTCFVSVYCNPA